MKKISENKAFSGTQQVYSHFSKSNDCEMTFGIFLPEEASNNKVPILWYLSGLTCTHENAMTKSGAQVWAAEQGIALIFPILHQEVTKFLMIKRLILVKVPDSTLMLPMILGQRILICGII